MLPYWCSQFPIKHSAVFTKDVHITRGMILKEEIKFKKKIRKIAKQTVRIITSSYQAPFVNICQFVVVTFFTAYINIEIH